MRVVFKHRDWSNAPEGEAVKTTFLGVRKVWFEPEEGLICLLLQSGWVYEHELEREWEYAILNDECDDYDYTAVDFDGKPRGYFRS